MRTLALSTLILPSLLLFACADAGSSTSGADPSCGDGVVDPGEACDDGNRDSGDGCSADCAVEGEGGSGAGTTSTGGGGAGGMGGAAEGGAGGAGGSGPPLIACDQTITINAPGEDAFVAAGDTLSVGATVADPAMGNLQLLTVRWEGDDGTVLGQSPVSSTGFATTTLTFPSAVTRLHARVITPQGICDATTSKRLYVCTANLDEDFNVAINPAVWTTFGNASWNPAGWLDMTALAQNQQGAIYNDSDAVTSGNTSIRFKLYTGGGSTPGADGFALTIIETQQPGDLATLVAAAHNGGGLGYGVGGNYGSFAGAAFTVEIDTWYNQFNGTTELHTDPIMGNHLEITLDGDPGNSLVATALPNVQDQQWHDLQVDIVGTRVRVWYDAQLAIDVTDPNLVFKGGRVFFSGSTGFYYNWHRFDDLSILHTCN
ncbi:MAG: hypothetical protein R3B72_49250 [Polyangiaceae bacterium]